MSSDALSQALSTTASALADSPELARALYDHWHDRRPGKDGAELPAAVREAAAELDRGLPGWTHEQSPDHVERILGQPAGEVVFIWAAANAARSEARLAPILKAAAEHREYADQTRILARNRVVEGPLEDALGCLPLLGAGDALAAPDALEARARTQILLWEAGARALELPALGRWLWADERTFETMVGAPARGTLRGRVLAARCLEISVGGMPPATDQRLVGRTLQVLQPLLLHPEPLVWIHAARSFGRLAGTFEPLEGTLLDWVHGASPVLRQRALTAFASLPSHRLAFLGHELESIIESPDNESWVLAAAAAATPYLFSERRDLWDRLAERIGRGDGGAVAARALARGLATLWRRGRDREAIEPTYRALRHMARRAETDEIDDWRRWLETIAVTDPIDGAERDPLDLELGLENLVRLAAHYDDEEADARAARFAGTLASTFSEAQRVVLGDGSLRHRASAMNAYEGCARSLALRLWGPMLATRPAGDAIVEPDLEETWSLVARAPSELLDIVRERRAVEGEDDDAGFTLALEVLALKLGGYALDACGEDADLGPGRGPTAHETCLWLRKLQGLADGSRQMPAPLHRALSALFWRLVDTTRGTALGEVDDVQWLGPFAAWWALVIDRPAVLTQLANALPMIADGALETCCELADEIRTVLSGGAPDGGWGPDAMQTLQSLRAEDTELAEALAGFARALEGFADASGVRPDLEARCLQLVLAGERLQAALADPVRALHAAEEAPTDDSLAHAMSENAPRMASVVARAIRKREMALLDVWLASLGPVASALAEDAVQSAMRRTPPPPPTPKKKEPKKIVGYELVKPLGEGGIGSVWLVRKPGADRFFVLKIPKADVLQSASDTEREGILASFTEEAKALAGLYHPNVANIIDRGVDGDVPYLVLEYLIGADLKQYASAQLMTLFELRKVVVESCAGLTALHNAGLVHRDIKPANLWLRLPLAGGERFDPEQHRDPARATPLATVIIDFGMVRATRVSADVGGRFVAGTPGYIAPEQVLDPVELDVRADVYALAGTIYNVTTGRTFFDDIEDPRERIIAHMRNDPMEDASRFADYPAGLVKLLRAATTRDPRDRPTPLEFGREFAALL
ncbi:MAG TPA: serine/threonine-protein kinase [Sandaracinaceae bacterium LLY-WYZ-13_1]|nr:serine/threonine-protein kinase [Sandaracinaceae bacterium LLY-WYZ-13_1]